MISLAELLDTNSATATDKDILNGKTAYAKGKQIVGTIPLHNGGTFDPGISSKTVAERGQYMVGDIVVEGDANLLPENIKKDVTIFGVRGIAEEEPPVTVLPDGVYNISLQPSELRDCAVSGGGIASKGTTITVHATSNTPTLLGKAYTYGWKENDTLVSTDADYTFTVDGNRDLRAVLLSIQRRIPSDYTELEYVHYGDNGQHNGLYIGVGVDANTTFSIDFEITKFPESAISSSMQSCVNVIYCYTGEDTQYTIPRYDGFSLSLANDGLYFKLQNYSDSNVKTSLETIHLSSDTSVPQRVSVVIDFPTKQISLNGGNPISFNQTGTFHGGRLFIEGPPSLATIPQEWIRTGVNIYGIKKEGSSKDTYLGTLIPARNESTGRVGFYVKGKDYWYATNPFVIAGPDAKLEYIEMED